jgi:hypothetical protein
MSAKVSWDKEWLIAGIKKPRQVTGLAAFIAVD